MPIIIGKPAPDFETQAVMPDGQFKAVKLSDYKGKWVILFFYPLAFTFVCPTEITQYSDAFPQFKALNTEVLACSVDSQFANLAWTMQPRNKGGLGTLQIPLVCDLTKKISTDYGVLINDGPDAGVALRGLFIIDPAGNVRQVTINDLPVGRNVEETMRLLQAFQHHEKTGSVMPCGWKPGSKTMEADPKKSQEYFNALQ
jgi:alkyl hydroperoxide reductase subunit AhpC